MGHGRDDQTPTTATHAGLAELKRRLAASEHRFDVLVNGTGDGIFMVDTEGRFVFVNEFIARSSGFPAAAFVGRHYLELIREEDRETVRRNFDRTIAGEEVPAYELAYRTARGELMWVELKGAPLFEEGVVTGAIAITRNIQERKRMELALRESEEKYRSLIETLPHIVAIIQDSRVVFANEKTRRVLGADPVTDPRALPLFTAPSQRERLEGMLERRARGEDLPSHYRTTILTESGRELPIELYVQPMQFRGRPAVQCVAIDRSEQAQLEAQVQQSQKMEALGTLAGGVAHDFNNLLVAILATAELLKYESPLDSDTHQAAETIERAAHRAAGLTKQLLGFARKQRSVLAPVDAHALIDEACELLARTVGKHIVLRRALDADRALVMGESGQLEQVLVNLAVNARDAMPDGGELTLATRSVQLEEADLLAAYELASGPYLEISVSDTGVGIAEEVRARMFEPFFTTKPQGTGSGMGLAVVYGIVRSHHGALRVDSAPGRGTTISVFLPLATEVTHPASPSQHETARGRGTILVVDDEELPRHAARSVMQALGYTVLACGSGAQALELYRARGDEIDLAFVDVMMPEMDGWQCLRALRELDPTLEVLMTSGLAWDREEILDPTVELISKPYGVQQLAAALARRLGRAAD